MSSLSVRVRHQDLERFVTDAFVAKGMAQPHAATVAEVLVWANLRGGDSHGVQRLPRYFEMIEQEEMDPRGEPRTVLDTGVAMVIDAQRTAGPVVMMETIAQATERAKKHGLCLAVVSRATHAGAIGRYTQWAAERGFASIMMAAGLPLMAYHGARTRSLSTNPIAIAVPSGRYGPIALDMATSVVAAGRIAEARTRGETIPEGWALTENGTPTTDPHKAVISLPLGGPKGSGLALMIELLTAGLGGSAILTKYLGPRRSRRAQQNVLTLVIDIATFRPPEAFAREADELADLLKQLPRQDGFDEILLPGERGRRIEAERRQHGIPIPTQTWRALEKIGEACGVEMPAILPVSA
jgi:ureidoglycolate dehydrogenase (NAD+)